MYISWFRIFLNFWYQGGVKSTVFVVFEDIKFKISEGYKQNWIFPVSALLVVSRAATAGKADKVWSLPRFWVSIPSYKKQPVKKFWGRILDIALLKFAVAALRPIKLLCDSHCGLNEIKVVHSIVLLYTYIYSLDVWRITAHIYDRLYNISSITNVTLPLQNFVNRKSVDLHSVISINSFHWNLFVGFK